MEEQVYAVEAEACAEQTLSEHGVIGIPVDPFAIAEANGILVRADPQAGVSGCLLKCGDSFGIFYSTAVPNDRRVRFTVAHELGHFFLPGHPAILFSHGDGLHVSASGFTSTQWYERQADYFAASLLMPRTPFAAELRLVDLKGIELVEHLAARCETSLTATAIRYARLSEDPVAVIVSSRGRIEYCFLSDSIRDLPGVTRPRRGSPIPRKTVTGTLDGDARGESVTTLDVWFDGCEEIEVNEDALALGNYGKVLTVLFSQDALLDGDD